jgi:prepilin-type N-terminal cleavage/methylation domain-containing protein
MKALPADRRGGYTLVELLIVISIIGILASISLAVLFASQERARTAQTRALVVWLDQVVQERWESYRTRRLPIATSGMGPLAAQQARLVALRELMRLEMPDRWNDVTDDPVVLPSRPALSLAYQRRYLVASPTDQYESAECLYLIATMGRADDGPGPDRFAAANTGDADGDGMLEFQDGWGHPMSFLRWAPGFVSPLQPELPDPDPSAPPAIERDQLGNHDPFDPLRVDLPGPPSARRVFRLVPLVYSAGPDGVKDIISFNAATDFNDPYAVPPAAGRLRGQPYDADGDGPSHLDNIHNHALAVR